MHAGSAWLLFANTSPGLQWWQVATGVLGIPAAVVTILGGWRISQKTRLEARKLQLEIQEKQGQAAHTEAPGDGAATPTRVTPTVAVAPVGLIAIGDVVTRFVIFFLLIEAWGLIASLVNPLVFYTLNQLHLSYSGFFGLGLSYVSLILDLPRYLIFALIGWPLLTDIARSLGLTPRTILRKPARIEPRTPAPMGTDSLAGS